MDLSPDVEATLLRAVRQVPDKHSDAAWAYIADEMRHWRYPDVAGIADAVVEKYGNRKARPR